MLPSIANTSNYRRNFIELAFFSVVWLCCAWFASRAPVIAIDVILIALVIKFLITKPSARHLIAILILSLIGICIDNLLALGGFVSFANGDDVAQLTPFWLAFLWVFYIATVPPIFARLNLSFGLLAIIGAVGGGSSYWGGAVFDAVALSTPIWLSLLLITMLWLIWFPASVLAFRKFGVQ
ncbi:MAG: DUF2878 family protein [Gammaproteobacteria bacterium]|nr:DUF2878 family protein [Gammaproteobacteria bacterium]